MRCAVCIPVIISGVLATQIAANVGDAPDGIQISYCSVLALPVGWWGACGGMHGEMQGKYYRYCSRSIRYSTDLNSENNIFDLETFDPVSEYCKHRLRYDFEHYYGW